MKAFTNLLSDNRVSPERFASDLMVEHPKTQEMFIILFTTYISAMANRTMFHEEVEHLVLWSRDMLHHLKRH